MSKLKNKVLRTTYALLLMFGCLFTTNNINISAADGSASNGNGKVDYHLIHKMKFDMSYVTATTYNSKRVNRVTASVTIKNYYTGANMDTHTHNNYNWHVANTTRTYNPTSAISKQPTSAFSSHTTVHTYGYTYYLSQACQ